jgi:hypothetical protein
MNRLPAATRDATGRTILVIAIIAVAGGVGVTALGFLRKRACLLLALLLVVVCTESINIGVLPSIDPYLSARWHGQLLHNDAHPDRIFTYELPRSWCYGLAFYLHRELPEWSPGDPDAALVLTTPDGLRDMRQLGRFRGELDETARGVLYVPVVPIPRRLSVTH